MELPKFTQVHIASSGRYYRYIVALAENGEVWLEDGYGWCKKDKLQGETNENN